MYSSLKNIFFLSICIIYLFACQDTPTKVDISDVELEVKGLPKILEGTKKMVLIPKGTFVMGSLKENNPDNEPLHNVMLVPFYMDETPITYEDFKKYLYYGGTASAYWELENYNQQSYPITGISWYHAIDYCNWRSSVEGLEPAYLKSREKDEWGYILWELDTTKNGYRLPTEAQFEYAARGGLSQKNYPWGDKFSQEYANLDNEQGYKQGNWTGLVKVTEQKKNNFGLYNMSGNIWHWCNDWYDKDYYRKEHQTTFEPQGPEDGKVKVVRGGSWGSINKNFLTVANRSFTAPSNYNFDIGFRCVLPLKGLEALDKLKKDNGGKIPKSPKKEKFKYDFFNYSFLKKEYNPLDIELYSEAFTERLAKFISEYYPNSLYFLQGIDEQPKVTARELSEMIVEVSQEHKIHPLFVAGVMAAESGFGSCSFPRWFNNPVAFQWKNQRMDLSEPVYQDPSGLKNLRFKTLRDAFHAFCEGIRNPQYLAAARKNFVIFHILYVGTGDISWMTTVSRVYHDVLRVRFTPDMPEENIGRMIYMDWEEITNPQNLSNSEMVFNGNIPLITMPQKRFYLFFGSFSSEAKARIEAKKHQGRFRNIKIVLYDDNYRISLDDFDNLDEAASKKFSLEDKYKDTWVFEY